MTQHAARIRWDDDEAEMDVIFDDDCDTADNDDEVFFYGWKPEVTTDYGYEGWIVVEVYDEL